MQINCPHCGPRDVSEFTYHGDASRQRPASDNTDQDTWNLYVYGRDNPRGKHSEFWQHTGGCRTMLRAERNTLTHEFSAIHYAKDAGASS